MSGRSLSAGDEGKLVSDATSLSNSRSRKKMQGVANVSFLAMFIMYLLAALFGYLTFNGEQHDPNSSVVS